MRWIIDVKGCFYTCSCPDDLRVCFALNLLLLGAKSWWKSMTVDLSPTEKATVTWERFVEMFLEEYVALLQRYRLAHEYMSLLQMIETVNELTRMFQERTMFSLDYTSTEQTHMAQLFSMLKKDIKESMLNY